MTLYNIHSTFFKRQFLSQPPLMFVSNKKIMVQDYNLLDFLAEVFLQQGASVTFQEFSGIPALKVTSEGIPSRIFIRTEEEVSEMAFLKQHTSEEIYIPVLKAEEEIRLKAALQKAGVKNLKVYRLSLLERYNWYSREFMNRRTSTSASAESLPNM